MKSTSSIWLRRVAIVIAVTPVVTLPAQTAFTWQQIKDKFEAANPTLKAAQLNIDESRAEEITAYLRPNPDLTAGSIRSTRSPRSLHPTGGPNVYSPFAYTEPSGSIQLPA